MGRPGRGRQAKELGRDRVGQGEDLGHADQLAAAGGHPTEGGAVAAAGAVAGGHGAAVGRADEGAAGGERRAETRHDVGDVDIE